ncbi:MAG: hypothetical protein ACLVG5_04320 [Clostridium sp.]
MDQTLEEMRQDGTSLKIIGKYLDDPEKYLEWMILDIKKMKKKNESICSVV